jgi:predicted acylesterase/phospholipase RssA
MTELRLALTITGAVSLGAYEGGALAALLVGLQALRREGKAAPIVIDVIAGASAGSITGLLAAWTLLEGGDPIKVMQQAWVEGDALETLRARDASAPFSLRAMKSLGESLFTPVAAPIGPVQQNDVYLDMALAALRGFAYRIASLEASTPIEASSYLDWKRFTFQPKGGAESYTKPAEQSPLDFALASGANAFGFPPVVMSRGLDKATYEKNGVMNFPASNELWYTDGGTVDNEPIGRAIEMANERDSNGRGERLHLLIHPHPSAPPGGGAWADRSNPPTWAHTLARAFHMETTQSMYDDLKRMQKTNSRLIWRDRLVTTLSDGIRSITDPSAVEAIRDSMRALLASFLTDENALRSQQGRVETGVAVADDVSIEDLIRAVVDRVGGLVDRRSVAVEVISPLLLLQPGETVEDVLAGEFLLHFGGFFSRDLRMSDFVLGYRSMLKWMEDGWTANGVSEADSLSIHQAVTLGVGSDWDRYHEGQSNIRSLGWRAELDAARLAAHIGRVVAHDVRHWDRQG